MNIIFQYPTWFVLICIAVGLLYAFGMYYKDSRFGEQTKKLNPVLGTLRFLTVTIICLLLLDPVMRATITEKKAPIVVLAQDNSQSLLQSMDSLKRKEYKDKMETLKQNLAGKYDLKVYSFGDEVREGLDYTYSDKVTNISRFLEEIYDMYSNQNLGTVIMASDGIFNQGNNPIYIGGKLNVPIFSIALGDTAAKKDLVLKKVYNNQIAYLGDKFTIQVDIAAINCSGNNSRLSVSRGGRTLYDSPIILDNNDFFVTKEIILDADVAGVQRYTVAISSVPGEVTTANNVKEIYIDVLDARQRILLLAESPHPDIAALRRMITANKNYEVELAYAGKMKESAAKYDFVVLHQLPSKKNPVSDVINIIKTQKIPHWYIVGTLSDLSAFNQAQSLMTINGRINQTNDVEGVLNPNFKSFTLNEKLGDNIFKFPPITTPFGDFKVRADAEILLTQKIGTVNTNFPLLAIGEERGVKMAVLGGEGIWKWRIFDHMQRKNFDLFDELTSKIIQYLGTKEDKRRFRAFASSNLYSENEKIVIDAELYNENYERINEPDAVLEITNEEGKKFPYTFNRSANAYTLNAGMFPAGIYKYEAKTSHKGEILKAGGQFTVQAIQLELFETSADHRLLNLLSSKNGGELVYPDNMDKLAELINAKGFAKPVLYDTVKTQSLIHLKWIFFLLLFLLSLEWFLRRYFGAY
jgi:hypothetical protein